MFQASDITHGGSLRGLSERRKGDPVSGRFLVQCRIFSSRGRRGELNKVGWKYVGVAEVCFSSLISSSLSPTLLSIPQSPEGLHCKPLSFLQGFLSVPGWGCPEWLPLPSHPGPTFLAGGRSTPRTGKGGLCDHLHYCRLCLCLTSPKVSPLSRNLHPTPDENDPLNA